MSIDLKIQICQRCQEPQAANRGEDNLIPVCVGDFRRNVCQACANTMQAQFKIISEHLESKIQTEVNKLVKKLLKESR